MSGFLARFGQKGKMVWFIANKFWSISCSWPVVGGPRCLLFSWPGVRFPLSSGGCFSKQNHCQDFPVHIGVLEHETGRHQIWQVTSFGSSSVYTLSAIEERSFDLLYKFTTSRVSSNHRPWPCLSRCLQTGSADRLGSHDQFAVRFLTLSPDQDSKCFRTAKSENINRR